MSNENNSQVSAGQTGLTYTVAKYLILLAIAGFVAFIVMSERQANVPFENVRAAVEAAIDQETMHDVGSKGAWRYYQLQDTEYDGILLYQSVSGMSAEEILLVKVKDQNQLDSLKETIENRRESRINDFAAYAPEEAATMEDAELIVKGKYVLFLPYSQAAEVKQAFLSALGE